MSSPNPKLNGSVERLSVAFREVLEGVEVHAVERSIEPLRSDIAELKTDAGQLKMDIAQVLGEVTFVTPPATP